MLPFHLARRMRARARRLAFASALLLASPAAADPPAPEDDVELAVFLQPAFADDVAGLAGLLDLVEEAIAANDAAIRLRDFGIDDAAGVGRVTIQHAAAGTAVEVAAALAPEAVEAALEAGDRWQRADDGDWTNGVATLRLTDGGLHAMIGTPGPVDAVAACERCVVEATLVPGASAREAHAALAPLESATLRLDANALTIRLTVIDDAAATAGAEELRSALARAAAMPEVAALGVGPVLEQADVTATGPVVELTLATTGPAWTSLMESVEALLEEELR